MSRLCYFAIQSVLVVGIVSSIFVLIMPASLYGKHSRPPVGEFSEFLRVLEHPTIQTSAAAFISLVVITLCLMVLFAFCRQWSSRPAPTNQEDNPTDHRPAS